MTGALFKKVISSLSYGRSKFGPKSEEFCYAFARVPKIGYGVVIIRSRLRSSLKIRIQNQDFHSEIIINMVYLMSELPVDEMAPYAPQYDAIVTKYWWEVRLVVIHQPRQYKQPRCWECCVPGPPTPLAPRELMKQDRDLKEMPCSSAKRMEA